MKFEKHKFLTEQDELSSRQLSTLQRQNIENTILDCVHEKLEMTAELPNYPMKQEYLRGQIAILSYLLALDDNSIIPTDQ